jgi:signal transduction histidine kinase
MRAFREQRPRVVTNARERNLANPAYVTIHQLISASAWDTTVSVPLVVRGQSLGVLNVYYATGGAAAEAELPLLEAIAGQAAVAVENARLFLDAEAKAALEERQRLARELHDSVSQALYGIGLGARTARALLDRDPARADEPLEYVLQLAEAGLSEMRALIFELRPESLEREPMSSALHRLARALRSRHGITVRVDAADDGPPEPPFEIKEALYRIAQEALHNIVKHADTDNASVALTWTPGEVRLVVRDRGRGFVPGGPVPGHLGLRTMRERAHRVGGELAVRSAPGEGTAVEVTIPLANDRRDPAAVQPA